MELDTFDLDHSEMQGKQTSSKFYSDLLAGRRGIEDLELRCKVCNILHYSERLYGKLPYKIIWPGNNGVL